MESDGLNKTAVGLIAVPINLVARFIFIFCLDLFAIATFLRISNGRLHPAHSNVWQATAVMLVLCGLAIHLTGRTAMMRDLLGRTAVRRGLKILQVVLFLLLLFPSMVVFNT